ncbi:hypothetical protein NC796_21715 [Aliifodinibius sp. S!AR15-10]|uniref:hypothetical protein n=1 Tax=Aliifodinibius sp. S!AR15-10 TaxID=2950437 RepID=UPI00285EAEF6|nr:hypothetical protein [Aliifodinibius sp. S!AR15-10]MDR8393786.1 hypothetical protein [Aliifodinibius sp. S!AR15-10]
MKPDKLLLELEELVGQAGYEIRKERGTFRGDHCIVEGDKLVMINKNRPVELQVGILARVLQKLNMQDTYIKPAVRKELEELWDRFDRFSDKEIDELDFDQE